MNRWEQFDQSEIVALFWAVYNERARKGSGPDPDPAVNSLLEELADEARGRFLAAMEERKDVKA